MKTLLAPLGVFLILLASYAFFWHARDWNASSRMMLTYALVDRGTVCINGLEDHTRDRARIADRYYSDKLPGFSLLAAPVYLAAKAGLGLPAHPLNRKGVGFTHWASDYWIAVGTSGLLSALCGALLTLISADLGCGPRRASLVGLAYGLATPAYVYATMSYGHQATAFFLLAAFAAIERSRRSSSPMILSVAAGFCVAAGPVVELQTAPASLVIAAYFLSSIVARKIPPRAILGFAIGGAAPSLALLIYNVAAFGSPFDMGYFHEDLDQFKEVHSATNPLGLRGPAWGRAGDLLWREHRGLLVYAPILLLAPLGWVVLVARRRWAFFLVSLATCAALFLVNLSYPEWTGGWATGPRLLVPLLPFAMLPVAAALAVGRRAVTTLAVALAIVGAVEMLMFQGLGGRIPPAPEPPTIDSPYARPLREVVLPMWRGGPLPPWKEGARFDRNLAAEAWPAAIRDLPEGWRWLQFVPLVAGQVLAIGALMLILGRKAGARPPEPDRPR